jgi:hypothetical protein
MRPESGSRARSRSRLLRVCLFLPLASGCASLRSEPAAASSSESNVQGTVSFLYGAQSFHGGSVFGSGSQPVLGFSAAAESPGAPIGFEAGGFWELESADSANGLSEIKMREVFIGIWKPMETGSSLRPYVGGGAAGIHAELQGSLGKEDDASTGMYLHGGVLWELAPNVVVSLDLRTVLLTHLQFSGISGNGDYTQLALGLGVRF